MKLSAKSRYASRILLDLALHNEGVPHRVNDISERTGITVPFIEQIIKPLKHAGMVTSKRGAAGGHQLGRSPENITLGDIVRIMEGSVELSACLSAPELCERTAVCAARDVDEEDFSLSEVPKNPWRASGCFFSPLESAAAALAMEAASPSCTFKPASSGTD